MVESSGLYWSLYTLWLFQIWFYTAVFYGVLCRISPATFLHLKIQLETARFEPQTFWVPIPTKLSWLDNLRKLVDTISFPKHVENIWDCILGNFKQTSLLHSRFLLNKEKNVKTTFFDSIWRKEGISNTFNTLYMQNFLGVDSCCLHISSFKTGFASLVKMLTE